MAWERVGPFLAQNRALIELELEADTRKLTPLESFQRVNSPEIPEGEAPVPTLRAFVERRAGFLLRHPEIDGDDSDSGQEQQP